jgi:DNA-directed RNA polymerase subunit RPC12/RpoP
VQFRVEPTGTLPPEDRWQIVNDAELVVCHVEYRTWADHICNLLNAAGVDAHPTPEQQEAEEHGDMEEISRRDNELRRQAAGVSLRCPACGAHNMVTWQPGQRSFRCSKCSSVIDQRTEREAGYAPSKR